MERIHFTAAYKFSSVVQQLNAGQKRLILEVKSHTVTHHSR